MVFKRNVITHLNKYQKRIIYPVLFTCLSACISTLMCVAYIYYPEEQVLVDSFDFKQLKFYIPWILIFTSFLLVIVIFWLLRESNTVRT